jgi:hypothetical protein
VISARSRSGRLASDDHLRGLTFDAGGPAAIEPRSPHFALTAGLSLLLLATVAGV